MAEVLVQDTSIIATADAIREKMDSTDLIKWVAGKGFADAISSLVKFPDGISEMASGVYIPTYTTAVKQAKSIAHGMSKAPNFVLFTQSEVYMSSDPLYSQIILYQGYETTRGSTSGSGSDYLSTLYDRVIITYSWADISMDSIPYKYTKYDGSDFYDEWPSDSETNPSKVGGADETNIYIIEMPVAKLMKNKPCYWYAACIDTLPHIGEVA